MFKKVILSTLCVLATSQAFAADDFISEFVIENGCSGAVAVAGFVSDSVEARIDNFLVTHSKSIHRPTSTATRNEIILEMKNTFITNKCGDENAFATAVSGRGWWYSYVKSDVPRQIEQEVMTRNLLKQVK